MTKEMIISAYCKIRTIDNTIPDDVLDFMKESALEALTKQTGTNTLVSGSLPPRHPFIDALVENTECAARDEGIYFADSIRDNEERTDWFNKMIEDYQRQ